MTLYRRQSANWLRLNTNFSIAVTCLFSVALKRRHLDLVALTFNQRFGGPTSGQLVPPCRLVEELICLCEVRLERGMPRDISGRHSGFVVKCFGALGKGKLDETQVSVTYFIR